MNCHALSDIKAIQRLLSGKFFILCCAAHAVRAVLSLEQLLGSNGEPNRKHLLRHLLLLRHHHHQLRSPVCINGAPSHCFRPAFGSRQSDRANADGAMWFGTETGLARFDGRRTQTINDPALPIGRILALQVDKDGAMWIGTEAGAARFSAGVFEPIKETSGQAVSAIATDNAGLMFMTTEARSRL